ncbi:unnamed protein product [Schistocephalus solidus]|uniref:G_PROTEIN_RECEP_F1_2 domain-containing protein n=1 Tax=Schistocephalus solidus TaxID=70667 RepID=A0A183TGM8_SCHSO|nr:unnamed protein product [Schistocephalus solidus]
MGPCGCAWCLRPTKAKCIAGRKTNVTEPPENFQMTNFTANEINPEKLPSCPFDDQNDLTSVTLRYAVPALFGIVDVIGFIGNLLVIIVILGYASMRNSTNILILSLAFADFSFIICCVPLTAMVYATAAWPLPEIMCKTYLFLTYFSVYCSIYTLVLMCLDRFLAVVFPLRSRTWRTTKNTSILVAVTWVIIISFTSPIFVTAKVLRTFNLNSTTSCMLEVCQNGWLFEYNTRNEILDFSLHRSRIFFGIFFVLGYAFPLVVICFFYSILLCKLLCGRASKMSKSAEANRGKKKATKVVIVVVLVFAFCWLPIQVVFMIQNFSGDTDSFAFRMAHVVGNVLAYANSSVNPILYAFCSESFRMGFAALLCLDRSRMRQMPNAHGAKQPHSQKRLIAAEEIVDVSNVHSDPNTSHQQSVSKSRVRTRQHFKQLLLIYDVKKCTGVPCK